MANFLVFVAMAGTEPKTETNVPPTITPTPPAPMTGTEPKTETDVPLTDTPKSQASVGGTELKAEIAVSPTQSPKSAVIATEQIKTVNVTNVSKDVTEKDIWEFFSFSGNIHYIELKSESEKTQHAFVTFKESQGANTAVLLTGATIGELPVSVSHVENYKLPPEAPPLTQPGSPGTNADRKHEVAQKAEEVVSTMLAKGYVLGKDALQRAKSFDEKHQFTSNASAKVASLDRKMGLTQKISTGTAVVNEKMKEVNERYQVTEATKSAIAKAEQKANSAGSALMSNRYVSSGATWVSGAFYAIAKAAGGVGSKTKEKVQEAEKEKEGSATKEKVQEADKEKGGSETKENVQAEEKKDSLETEEKVQKAEVEKDGLKTEEKVCKAEEEKDGSKTTEKVHVDESSNTDSSVVPVKTSDDKNNLPIQ
uniref:binding partner of ACD11 1-like n=1 Tax=Erigeron canadensis TaxID=72917 RepID=UPI001CB9B557|nr:binding partner of ACD11 1-like [Erigeron canadensis]